MYFFLLFAICLIANAFIFINEEILLSFLVFGFAVFCIQFVYDFLWDYAAEKQIIAFKALVAQKTMARAYYAEALKDAALFASFLNEFVSLSVLLAEELPECFAEIGYNNAALKFEEQITEQLEFANLQFNVVAEIGVINDVKYLLNEIDETLNSIDDTEEEVFEEELSEEENENEQ